MTGRGDLPRGTLEHRPREYGGRCSSRHARTSPNVRRARPPVCLSRALLPIPLMPVFRPVLRVTASHTSRTRHPATPNHPGPFSKGRRGIRRRPDRLQLIKLLLAWHETLDEGAGLIGAIRFDLKPPYPGDPERIRHRWSLCPVRAEHLLIREDQPHTLFLCEKRITYIVSVSAWMQCCYI